VDDAPNLSSPAAASTVAAALLPFLLAACLGPDAPQEKRGSLEELGKLMAAAEPVRATQVEGEHPLEGDPFALADPMSVQEGTSGQTPVLAPRQDPYIRFGERIIVRPGPAGSEFITKPYTMPVSKAQRLVDLMGALEPFPFRARPAADPATNETPPLDPGVLEYQILGGWDEEFYSNLVPPEGGKPPATPDAPKAVILSDVLVVTASYDLIEQFEDFLDLFAAGGVPQIELEAKIIEVVETDQLDVGSKASVLFGDSNFVQGAGQNLPNFAGGETEILPGSMIKNGTEAILNLGALQSSLAFDAVIEAIRTWDNVQIDSRPKTVVRAGGVAFMESATEFPFSEIKTISENGGFTAATVFKKIGVQLYISPRIIGTKMLALDVNLIGSTQVGSQTTFTSDDGQVIEVPIIASRTAKTVVYIEPGQTLVIGGLTTLRERELVNKVPILGDIPLLGWLFRSKFTRTEKQHVLFAISPRILQNSDFETEF
jgi:type II secretory pathway component GspD/PulD (secretin)